MARKSVIYKLERHKWADEVQDEKRKNTWIFTSILATVLAFVIGGYSVYRFLPTSVFINGGSSDENVALFEKVYTIMKENWYFGKDIENLDAKLINDAINGMMQPDKDLHTYYMTQDSASSFVSDLSGTLVGIGASVTSITGENLIEKIYRNSPAEIAGIQPGDIIIGVDGVDVSKMTSSEMVLLTRGEVGTEVEVEIKRGLDKIKLKLTRSVISTSTYLDYDGDVAVLELNSFSENAGKEVKKALEEVSGKGIRNLVIDLRDNGGGYLSAYLEIADLFLPYGTISIQQETRDGKITQSYTNNKNPYTFDEIYLLINGNTASASEVFAAAMREVLGAKLVGTNTYGKGTVQNPQTLGNGGIMKFTTAQWLSSKGNYINGVGLAPDVEVEIKSGIIGNVSMNETDKIKVDTVSEYVMYMQMILDVLGYKIDRTDGYFSTSSEVKLKQFEKDHGLSADGILDIDTMSSLLSASLRVYHDERSITDIQKQKALELIRNG